MQRAQWFCFPMGTCLFPMGTSIDWVPIGNREHGNMAELGNTLGTWEQFFRVGNMGTTRGLGTIGNISKSGILKLGTIGNSWEQLGKFSELNCKPLRISQCRWGLVLYYECTGYCEWYISCFCTESSGHPQRAGLATARLGTVGNTWEQPDLATE